MAAGTVIYWNGASGWIKQTGVENIPTVYARDIMVLAADISSGVMDDNRSVSFDVDQQHDFPWLARNVAVS